MSRLSTLRQLRQTFGKEADADARQGLAQDELQALIDNAERFGLMLTFAGLLLDGCLDDHSRLAQSWASRMVEVRHRARVHIALWNVAAAAAIPPVESGRRGCAAGRAEEGLPLLHVLCAVRCALVVSAHCMGARVYGCIGGGLTCCVFDRRWAERTLVC